MRLNPFWWLFVFLTWVEIGPWGQMVARLTKDAEQWVELKVKKNDSTT